MTLAIISCVASKAIKGNYTTCDSTVHCIYGTDCSYSKFGVGTSSGTVDGIDSATWESSWVKRCMPCPYNDMTNMTTNSTGMSNLVNDPSYTAPSGQSSITYGSSIFYFS